MKKILLLLFICVSSASAAVIGGPISGGQGGNGSSGGGTTNYIAAGANLTAVTNGTLITFATGPNVPLLNTPNVFTASNTFPNVGVTGIISSPNVNYTTNSGSAISPNMAVSYALLSTNAAFSMLLPTGVDGSQTMVQTSVLVVTNTTAVAVLITTAASPVKSTGTWYVTNVSTITTIIYPKCVTNMICLPIF